jgi:hypothetical protein
MASYSNPYERGGGGGGGSIESELDKYERRQRELRDRASQPGTTVMPLETFLEIVFTAESVHPSSSKKSSVIKGFGDLNLSKLTRSNGSFNSVVARKLDLELEFGGRKEPTYDSSRPSFDYSSSTLALVPPDSHVFVTSDPPFQRSQPQAQQQQQQQLEKLDNDRTSPGRSWFSTPTKQDLMVLGDDLLSTFNRK